MAGSLAVLTAGGRWMIDCGAHYPHGAGDAEEREARAAGENQALPEGAVSVDGVFVTHAHLDHIGRLPLLVREGYRGPIYLTSGTAAIAPVMLRMQARYDSHRVRDWIWSSRSARSGRAVALHWAGCEPSTRIRNPLMRRCRLVDFEEDPRVEYYPCKSCGDRESRAVEALFRTREFREAFEAAPGVLVTFLQAGHIPGSASVLFELADGDRRVLFSGDLGNDLSTLFPGPAPAPAVDAVFVEATYGTFRRDLGRMEQEFRSFREQVGRRVADGGVAWIPAFALDRTQKILHQISLAVAEGLISPGVPVYCPSPSGREITDIYREAARAGRGWFRPSIEGRPEVFNPAGLIEAFPPGMGEGHAALPRPAVLITTSGMMDAAWSGSLLDQLLPDEAVSVHLVGWQDPESPGGRLKEGVRSLTHEGRTIPVRAQVSEFDCFSGHGDAADLDRWLSRVSKRARVVLVHGEATSLADRAADLRAAGWSNVIVATTDSAIAVP